MLEQYTKQKRTQQRKLLETILRNIEELENGYLCGNHLAIYYEDMGDMESSAHCGYIKSSAIRELLEAVKELKRMRGHEKRIPL